MSGNVERDAADFEMALSLTVTGDPTLRRRITRSHPGFFLHAHIFFC